MRGVRGTGEERRVIISERRASGDNRERGTLHANGTGAAATAAVIMRPSSPLPGPGGARAAHRSSARSSGEAAAKR
eukprot:813737-Prymnesium_polylepis.1